MRYKKWKIHQSISDVKLRDDTSLFKMRSLPSSKILANEIVNSSKATANETGARRCLNISGTASHVKRNQFNRTRSIRKKRVPTLNVERSIAKLGYTSKDYEPLRCKVLENKLSNIVHDAVLSISKDWAGSGSNEQVGILIDFFEALEAPLCLTMLFSSYYYYY